MRKDTKSAFIIVCSPIADDQPKGLQRRRESALGRLVL